jgi:hypothetical protein
MGISIPPGTAMNAIDPTRFAPDQLLTDDQLGEWMNCSARSARNWLAKHNIRPADVPGRTKWYRARDVRAKLEPASSEGEAP